MKLYKKFLKERLNKDLDSNIYFWSNHNGNEVDFVIDRGSYLEATEVKSSKTINDSFFKGLRYWHKLDESRNNYLSLVYGRDQAQMCRNIKAYPFFDSHKIE